MLLAMGAKVRENDKPHYIDPGYSDTAATFTEPFTATDLAERHYGRTPTRLETCSASHFMKVVMKQVPRKSNSRLLFEPC